MYTLISNMHLTHYNVVVIVIVIVVVVVVVVVVVSGC